jgi:mRNA-degrading endonuclease RelE of RelBE toxin-antitoxin system
MTFLISDTFTDSLARLSNDEQKQVKITAFDLQTNPDSPGLSFHKLDRARDKNFWSVRVSGDIRIIVHKTDDSLLVCYTDHHDKAYEWAERRKFSVHPVTGAAQIVEIREKIEEIVIHIRTSGRETQIPHRLQQRRTRTGDGSPVGKVDRIPAPGSERDYHKELLRAGSRVRHSRHRENSRRVASSRLARSFKPRYPSIAHYLY